MIIFCTGWYKDIWWSYYQENGRICQDRGVYFICDNDNHHWPMSICLYKQADSSTLDGYFPTNLEGVQKDV